MNARPDYDALNARKGFSWSCAGSQPALRHLAGIPIREYNLNPDACIDAYRRGRVLFRDRFGDDVRLPGIATPPVSYGHVNCLGSELIFPEGGEVGHTHPYSSLQEAIHRLSEPVDWAKAGMTPFFMDFRDQLRKAFPGEPVGLSWGDEGPVTTAYELRGDGFFVDIYDDPEAADTYMEAVTNSILDFHRWRCEVDGRPAVGASGGMVDDISSLLSPRLWPRFVIPWWEKRFQAITTGSRHAHVENLVEEHMPFLEVIGLSSFDPSISPKLNPQIIKRACRVPFTWRLGAFHLEEMTVEDVHDFVYQSCADGAMGVTMTVEELMCQDRNVPKVLAFIEAAKRTQQMISEGATPADVGALVSPTGRATLWEGWCGFLSPRSTRGGARR